MNVVPNQAWDARRASQYCFSKTFNEQLLVMMLRVVFYFGDKLTDKTRYLTGHKVKDGNLFSSCFQEQVNHEYQSLIQYTISQI